MEATAILQRTSAGLETVKTKSVRLTQSERLILIVVDGVTPYSELREKVWALSNERFTHAMNTLLSKELIFEVLLPDQNRQPEILDSSVIDHFLQQDPLDPVTIISADPEDHFGMDLIAEMGHALPSPASDRAAKAQTDATPANIPRPSLVALSPPAPVSRPNPAPAKSAHLVAPSQEIDSAPKIQPIPGYAAAAGPGAGASHSTAAKTGSYSVPRTAKNPAAPSKPSSRPTIGNQRSAHSGSSTKSGSSTNAPARSRPSGVRQRKKQSVDILKLCSWTGLISGFGIFLFLLAQYYILRI